MGIQLGYMGTKKFIAPHVGEVIAECAHGPVLDVFAGMGAVAENLAGQRPVWTNDIQIFASEVGRALFTSPRGTPSRKSIEDSVTEHFNTNRIALERRFRELLAEERESILEKRVIAQRTSEKAIIERLTGSYILNERIRTRATPQAFPYRLFTLTFAGTYFGLQQSIDIDSLRYAIDQTFPSLVDEDQKRWLILALGVVLIRTSVSTGHFAQYLVPKQRNKRFYFSKRSRNVLDSFWSALDELKPVGTRVWRATNRVFNADANSLLERLWLFGDAPAVVYADPPYSDDQYSRYYHIWETLVLYDYPESTGKGRYRPDRFQTPFALKQGVCGAVSDLAKNSARLGADLVLSYPGDGLLFKQTKSLRKLVLKHYRTCEVAHVIDHQHSTMGGSKGSAKKDVKEFIFVARN